MNDNSNKKKNTVVELFAGVGGFRVGLNNVMLVDNNVIENNTWDFVFSNQWEPATKTQHAYEVYNKRFGDNKNNKLNLYENKDISKVSSKIIPSHKLLVGGFPCQDYSVARSLKGEGGIEGKKGVLWWEIHRIVRDKKPPFVLLENVDRLLKSPSKQRGRDFGVMLKSFDSLGYNVEWRVINAAEYGFPQRRRRVFIFAFKKTTAFNKKNIAKKTENEILTKSGLFASTFEPFFSLGNENTVYDLNVEYEDVLQVSERGVFKFYESGVMVDGVIYSKKLRKNDDGFKVSLGDVLENSEMKEYYLDDCKLMKFKSLRDGKKINRTRPDGTNYIYSEGSMSEYDYSDLPGRTMLTSEATANRSSHVVLDKVTNKKRTLTEIEAERLNMFPDNWTNVEGVSQRKRYFMMGNALVTGVVKILGDKISEYD